MSDDDSGVDAGSDSNGSLSMSMGSSAPSDNEDQNDENHHDMQGAHHGDVHFVEHCPEEDDAVHPDPVPHVNVPTDSPQEEVHLPHVNPQPSTSGVPHFDLSWPAFNISGSSLINNASMHQFHSQWSPQQHDFCPKIRANTRKVNIRFNSVVNRESTGEKKLRIASNLNDIDLVKKLLDEAVSPKSCDTRQRTALHFAACKGHTQVASLLLERGADCNQRDIIGNTALHLAACTNHTAMVTLLLKAGTNINALDNSGRTPMNLAQSKLKLLKQSKPNEHDTSQLKKEVLQVVEMMQIYLQRSGKVAELDMLSTFTNRLHLHQTKEEMDIDVQELLNSLDHLTLQKKS